jgi:hypothetical protein
MYVACLGVLCCHFKRWWILTLFSLTEPVDGGAEMVLKLRLSSTCTDVKLPVCTKDTIGMAKKKLQVSKFDNIP